MIIVALTLRGFQKDKMATTKQNIKLFSENNFDSFEFLMLQNGLFLDAPHAIA